MKTFLLLLFSLFATTITWGQNSFSGTITDNEKITLPGVQVVLFKGDSIYAASLTNETGRFSIRDLPAGTYDLQITYPGYTPIEEERRIQGNMDYQFMLMPEMSKELGEVEVVGNLNDRVKRTATGQIFYLSEEAKNSGDPYKALKEIPKLISNDALREIKVQDGSTPLVLINGVAVNSGIAPVDPKDIESVEVMDAVSARYLRLGVKHIVNIKLKEKKAPYIFFETMTRHDVPIHLGMGALYFEIGNSKYSLYARTAADYTYHDDVELSEWQQGKNYYKQSSGESQANKHSFLGELLFKWMITPKDYMAFHVYGRNEMKKTNVSGNGVFEEGNTMNFNYQSTGEDKSNLFTTSLYHRHSFTEKKVLETTFAFNKNWNINEGERQEDYTDWLYRNIFKYDNLRSSASLNIDYSRDLGDARSLNLGSETRYINDRIHQVTTNYPIFFHREWSEYLYGAWTVR